MNNHILKIISIFFFTIIGISSAYAQMPPNPKLLEKVKRGVQSKPYVLQNLEKIRKMGVDSPWSTKNLIKQRNLNKTSRLFGSLVQPTGNWKALVILVQFSDKSHQVNSNYFDNLLFQNTSSSVNGYYKKISYGNLDIVTVNQPSSTGWQTAPQTYDYYCNGQNGLGTYPNNSQKLVEDIVQEVDPIVDFSKYDNDGDGYVDALFIVHAGPGAEFTGNNNDIWSHAWSTYYDQSVDGVIVSRYSVEPEYWQNPGDMTIGVFAHELGHAAFGLPDLYDVDYTSRGLGNWSLMAGGSWNGPSGLGSSPAMPDAYCRIQMGFVSPVVVSSNITGQTISNVEDNQKIYLLSKIGSSGSEYFLVENRQKTSFDQYLPGNGLLIYHVDESVVSDNMHEWYPGHTSSGHYLVALEQADGFYDLEKNINSGDTGDPYPGDLNNNSFASNTTPSSLAYDFTLTNTAVDNISTSASNMTADLLVTPTQKVIALVSPQSGEAIEAGKSYQIKWDSYLVNTIKIELSTNNGTNWSTIAENISASLNSYSWLVPDIVSTQCKIKISDESDPAINAVNSSPFFIFRWNTDYLVWEPVPSPSSGITIANLLENMGYSVAYSSSLLPQETIKYKAVFLCLGVYPNNHTLTGAEGAYFVSYLKQGGNIYMEGGNTWFFDLQTSLQPYFNIAGTDDGGNDLSVISGVTGTIMEGLSFNYNGENNFIDHISPINSAISIFQNNSPAFDCAIANKGDTYNSIGSSFQFGGLVDNGSTNTKHEVLSRILNFFNQTTGDPSNLSANLNDLTGLVSLNWQASSGFPGIFENFNDGTADNFVFLDNRFSVDNGYLKMNGLSDNTWAGAYYNKDFSNFICEYEFQRQAGDPSYTIGAFIRSNGNMGSGTESGYLVAITTNQAISVWEIKNGSSTNILPWSSVSVLNSELGAPNIISIAASNNIIQIYINGYYITDFDASDFLSGKIELCVYDNSGPSNTIWWDFFGVDENVQPLIAKSYPKSTIKVIGGGTSKSSPEISLIKNSVPAVGILNNIEKVNSNSDFKHFNVYRNNNIIDTTSQTHYSDQLITHGTFDYKVTALYNDGESNPAGPVSVDYNQKIELTYPTGGLTLKSGTVKQITWTSNAIDTIKIEFSSDNGTNWSTIANKVYAPTGNYSWTVPAVQSTQCIIKISAFSNPGINSFNQTPFSITIQGILSEIEPNDTPAEAMEIEFGDTVYAAISPVGDIDYYKLTGEQGDTLMIYGCERNSSQLEGRITLLNQNSQFLYEGFWFEATNKKQRIVYVLPYSGTYFIKYSYIFNWNLNSKYEKTTYLDGKPILSYKTKSPQLASDNGEYEISFNYFKKNKPQLGGNEIVNIYSDSVNVNSIVYPNGLPSKLEVEYGLTDSYGQKLTIRDNITGLNDVKVPNFQISGLTENTTYHYRIIGTNGLGTNMTDDKTFLTAKISDTWTITNINTRSNLTAIDAIDNLNIVAISSNKIDYYGQWGWVWQDLAVHKTTNTGSTWNTINMNTGDWYSALDYVNINKIVIGDELGELIFSDDGGLTWTQKQVGTSTISSISFTNSDVGYLANGSLYKTTDGGNSWNNISTNGAQVSYVQAFHQDTIYCSGGGKFLKSYDSGNNWIVTDVIIGSYSSKISFSDKNNGLFLYGPQLYSTTDAGNNWTYLITTSFNSIAQFDSQYSVGVCYSGLIQKTINGNYWFPENGGTLNTLNDACFTPGKRAFIAGDYGIILSESKALQVVAPNGGEAWKVGTTHDITWNSKSVANIKIEYTISEQSNRTTITSNIPANLGSYSWQIPNAATSSARVYISDTDNPSVVDSSDNVFTIYSPSSAIVSIDTVGGAAGDSIIIPINVSNFNNIGAIALKIHFNSSLLHWGRAVNWNNQLNGQLINTVDSTLSISWADVSDINISNGKLVDLKFLYDGSSSASPLSFINNLCEISDVNGNVLDVVYLNGAVIPGLKISGNITYDNNAHTALPDVKVYLSGTVVDSTLSDAAGNYSFGGLMNGTYQLNLSYNKPWGGVNSTDALIIKRHYVGYDTLQGLRYQAGDVNASGSLNSTDALVIQRRYVGFTDTFPLGDWIFESPEVTINGSDVTCNISGLAAGDVNGSYSPSIAKSISKITVSNEAEIEINDKGEIGIPVIAAGEMKVGAISLILSYPAGLMEVKEVSGKASGILFNNRNGILSISWSDTEPLTLKPGETILTIKIKTNKEFKAGDKLNLSLDPISELADEQGRVITNCKLDIPSVNAPLPKEYMLSQNYPNPFNPATTIKYDLPEQAKVKLEVFNVLGERVIVLEDKLQEAGSYKVEWNANNLSSGVYFYRFTAQGEKIFTSIKKMLLLK